MIKRKIKLSITCTALTVLLISSNTVNAVPNPNKNTYISPETLSTIHQLNLKLFFGIKSIKNGISKLNFNTDTTVPTTSLPNSTVIRVKFISTNLEKTGTNTAVFKYQILDDNNTDITKTIPASRLNAIGPANSSIKLEPTTGIGTITFASYPDTNKIIITLLDTVGGTMAILNPGAPPPVITTLPVLPPAISNDKSIIIDKITIGSITTKTSDNIVKFNYGLINKDCMVITNSIPASQLLVSTSINSTVVLDPLTGTGTITYNSPNDVNKPITITLVDKLSGITGSSTIAEPTKISKINITSTNLAHIKNIGYAAYSVYDQFGKDITNSPLTANLIFKSEVGSIKAKNGVITLYINADVDLTKLSSISITVADPVTGVSTNATLSIAITL